MGTPAESAFFSLVTQLRITEARAMDAAPGPQVSALNDACQRLELTLADTPAPSRAAIRWKIHRGLAALDSRSMDSRMLRSALRDLRP